MRSKGKRVERRKQERKDAQHVTPPKDPTQMKVPPHIAALAKQLKEQQTSSR